MSGNRLYIPGTDGSVKRFGGNGADSPPENRLFQPRVGCELRNWVPCRGAGETPGLMRPNVPVIAACLFGCLPRKPGDLE